MRVATNFNSVILFVHTNVNVLKKNEYDPTSEVQNMVHKISQKQKQL